MHRKVHPLFFCVQKKRPAEQKSNRPPFIFYIRNMIFPTTYCIMSNSAIEASRENAVKRKYLALVLSKPTFVK